MASDVTPKRILVIGDMMLDETRHCVATRLSPEAPVPVLHETSRSYHAGGAANVAKNILALSEGIEVALIGAVAADREGNALLDALPHGFSTVNILKGFEQTTHKLRYVAGGQQLIRVDNDARPLSREQEDWLCDRVREEIPRADVVVVSDYNKGVLTERVLTTLRTEVRLPTPVLIDPKGRYWSKYRDIPGIIFTPNSKEVIEASPYPHQSDTKAALYLSGLSGAIVVVTQGERGVTVASTDEKSTLKHFPSEARTVFDVTGAGDTFLAALAVDLANFASVVRPGYERVCHAAYVANVAAGLAVEKPGTAVVTRSEWEERLGR